MKKKKPFSSNALNDDHSEKAKSRKQMADELNLSIATFKRRLHEIKFQNGGRLITPREQIKIKSELGFLRDNPDDTHKMSQFDTL